MKKSLFSGKAKQLLAVGTIAVASFFGATANAGMPYGSLESLKEMQESSNPAIVQAEIAPLVSELSAEAPSASTDILGDNFSFYKHPYKVQATIELLKKTIPGYFEGAEPLDLIRDGGKLVSIDLDANDPFIQPGASTLSIAVWTANLYKYSYGDGKTCHVLLSGNSAPASFYLASTFRELKARGECVITFDYPGQGFSERLPVGSLYATDFLSNASAQLLDKLNITTNYILVGWSYGGNIILQGLNDNLFQGHKGVILADSLPNNIDPATFGFAFPEFGDGVLSGTCATSPNGGVLAFFAQEILTFQNTSDLVASLFADCQTPSPSYLFGTQLGDDGFRDGILQSFFTPVPRIILDEISAYNQLLFKPVRVVIGAGEELQDVNFWQPVIDAGFIATLIDDSVIVVGDESVGHSIGAQAPVEFSDTIIEFNALIDAQ